ncbi:hypothetical protein ACFSTC_41515 [Nonomuraea ferruginea]
MRTSPPFRADHVGSLLRPQRLLQARETLSGEALREIEDEAIREVVRRQEEIGLQSATDGEFRRASWHMDFIYRLGGIGQASDEHITVRFHNERGDIEFTPPPPCACTTGSGWRSRSSPETSRSCATPSPPRCPS